MSQAVVDVTRRLLMWALTSLGIGGLGAALAFSNNTANNDAQREIGGALVSGAVIALAVLVFEEIAEERRERISFEREERQIIRSYDLQLWTQILDVLQPLPSELAGHVRAYRNRMYQNKDVVVDGWVRELAERFEEAASLIEGQVMTRCELLDFPLGVLMAKAEAGNLRGCADYLSEMTDLELRSSTNDLVHYWEFHSKEFIKLRRRSLAGP